MELVECGVGWWGRVQDGEVFVALGCEGDCYGVR